MTMKAAFAEVDITPALPCEKPGWIVKILATSVDDPLYAHVLVVDDGTSRQAYVSLDVLSVRWPMAEAIRDRAEKVGIPRENVLVAATHNHTGPPVSAPGLATKDFKYIDELVNKVGDAIARAVASLVPVKLAIASGIESRVSFIRRCVMKDGTVKTHASGPNVRCPEGVIDPEVGLVAVKDAASDKLLGVLVNFTCHPTHNGGEPRLSAGWPGVLCNSIKQQLGKDVVTVFLNGALGDAHHANPMNCEGYDYNTKDRVGHTLAGTIARMLPKMEFGDSLKLASSRKTIHIPLRDIDGPLGVNFEYRQRFAPDGVYETLIAKLRRKQKERDFAYAEVQALRLTDETALVTLPCEPFTKIGLEIKMKSPFAKTYVVGVANGIVGYVPTEEAFTRGGYETTLSMGSKLDPSAARLLTQTALEQLAALQM